ncbi:MAG: hypothetical protein GX484_08415 [Chloroflexi bacterium]|nr:hypothetical protein [Chloroflexota bacterium]
MSFFDNIKKRITGVRGRVTGFFGGVNPFVWYAIVGLVVLIAAVVLLSVMPSSTDPAIVQLTIDAAVAQSDNLAPTLVSRLTQTPPQLALTGAAPTLSIAGRRVINQYAASAEATSQRGRLDYGAVQAVGPPNTPTCGDFRTAWASEIPTEIATLTLYFPELVRPSAIRIYETYNPGFITMVVFRDVFGDEHIVYEAAPQASPQCPLIREIPIENLELPGNTVLITVNQTTSIGGSNQIDAVELIGIKY